MIKKQLTNDDDLDDHLE
jgi:cell shape-determining protein MreC